MLGRTGSAGAAVPPQTSPGRWQRNEWLATSVYPSAMPEGISPPRVTINGRALQRALALGARTPSSCHFLLLAPSPVPEDGILCKAGEAALGRLGWGSSCAESTPPCSHGRGTAAPLEAGRGTGWALGGQRTCSDFWAIPWRQPLRPPQEPLPGDHSSLLLPRLALEPLGGSCRPSSTGAQSVAVRGSTPPRLRAPSVSGAGRVVRAAVPGGARGGSCRPPITGTSRAATLRRTPGPHPESGGRCCGQSHQPVPPGHTGHPSVAGQASSRAGTCLLGPSPPGLGPCVFPGRPGETNSLGRGRARLSVVHLGELGRAVVRWAVGAQPQRRGMGLLGHEPLTPVSPGQASCTVTTMLRWAQGLMKVLAKGRRGCPLPRAPARTPAAPGLPATLPTRCFHATRPPHRTLGSALSAPSPAPNQVSAASLTGAAGRGGGVQPHQEGCLRVMPSPGAWLRRVRLLCPGLRHYPTPTSGGAQPPWEAGLAGRRRGPRGLPVRGSCRTWTRAGPGGLP